MLHSLQSLSACAAVLGLGACSVASSGGPPPEVPMVGQSGARCEVNSADNKTEVLDHKEGFGLMLPGEGWRVQCPGQSGNLLQGERKDDLVLLNAGVGRFVLPDPKQFDERKFLALAYEKAAEGATQAGATVGPQEIVEVSGRLLLFVPVQMAAHERLFNMQVIRAVQAHSGEIYYVHLGWSSARAAWNQREAEKLSAAAVRFGVLPR